MHHCCKKQITVKYSQDPFLLYSVIVHKMQKTRQSLGTHFLTCNVMTFYFVSLRYLISFGRFEQNANNGSDNAEAKNDIKKVRACVRLVVDGQSCLLSFTYFWL